MRRNSARRVALGLAILASLGVAAAVAQGETRGERWFLRLWKQMGELTHRVERVESCTCCCEGVLEPVCAANGLSYVNRCEAECAGATVVAPGPCPGQLCGGPGGIACGEAQFCERPPGCDPLAFGRCEARPEVCTDEVDPVCGCDGVTYGNDCERRAAGVPLAHPGECNGALCSDDRDCPSGSFCEFPICPCELCLAPSLPGVCQPVPEVCPDIYDPVCGCDGVTYGNDCERRRARVSKAFDGPCEVPPAPCGGIAGLACPDPEQLCWFEPGTCDVADNLGSCVDVPEACIQVFDPVCGCDGRTYPNECEAMRARAQIDHPGPCEAS